MEGIYRVALEDTILVKNKGAAVSDSFLSKEATERFSHVASGVGIKREFNGSESTVFSISFDPGFVGVFTVRGDTENIDTRLLEILEKVIKPFNLCRTHESEVERPKENHEPTTVEVRTVDFFEVTVRHIGLTRKCGKFITDFKHRPKLLVLLRRNSSGIFQYHPSSFPRDLLRMNIMGCSSKFISLDDSIYNYILDNSLRESPLLRKLREETASLPMAVMQIAPEQGQFMSLLVRLSGARKALEIGTFTGYSAICIAQAMPPDGQLHCLDVSDEWTQVARRFWKEAGLESRISLTLAPAIDTLDLWISEGQAGTFDLAFIDADKHNYKYYYEKSLTLLRPGGLIIFDNVLWSGRVADPQNQEIDTVELRLLAKSLHHDSRIDLSMIPIADGLTLAVKR